MSRRVEADNRQSRRRVIPLAVGVGLPILVRKAFKRSTIANHKWLPQELFFTVTKQGEAFYLQRIDIIRPPVCPGETPPAGQAR